MAIDAERNTAINPDVVDAFAWAVTSANGPPAFPGTPPRDLATRTHQFIADLLGKSGHSPLARREAMATLHTVGPSAGTYVNESDFFQPDWQKAFWGPNYPRLWEIKHRYHPDGLFTMASAARAGVTTVWKGVPRISRQRPSVCGKDG